MKRRILNLGAGTQSSVLLVMADRGDIEPVECAIFADTQAEPREVYDHLDWLEKQVKTPVVRVTAGNLEADGVAFRRQRYSECSSTGRKGYASIPLFVLNEDKSQGLIRRQCTAEYKIDPITRYIRTDILGLAKGEVYRGGDQVEQVFGISFDERHRMRNSNGDPKWMLRSYPLVDLKLTRWQVIAIAEKWFPDRTFPRSACVFCPYKSNEEWRRMRDDHPDEWTRAVAFDHAIRDAQEAGIASGKQLVGLPFVHRQMVPLDQADLRSDDEKQGQLTLTGFANECEGMCGV
jgi:hypothetical protein